MGWTEHVIANDLWGVIDVDSADLTGDGRLDLVISTIDINGNGAGVYWAYNDNGAFGGVRPIDATLPNVSESAITDVDQDGMLDVIALSETGNQIVWYENTRTTIDPNPSFISHTLASSTAPAHFALSQLDADSAFEIFAATDEGLFWYDAPTGARNWTQNVIDDTFTTGEVKLFSADMDNDGDSDVVVADRDNSSLYWYRNDGAAGWTFFSIGNQAGITQITGGVVNGSISLVTSTYEQSGSADELVIWRTAVPTAIQSTLASAENSLPITAFLLILLSITSSILICRRT